MLVSYFLLHNRFQKGVLPIYSVFPMIRPITHVHGIWHLVSLRPRYYIPTKLIYTEICFTLVDVQYFACQDNKDLSAKTYLYYR